MIFKDKIEVFLDLKNDINILSQVFALKLGFKI